PTKSTLGRKHGPCGMHAVNGTRLFQLVNEAHAVQPMNPYTKTAMASVDGTISSTASQRSRFRVRGRVLVRRRVREAVASASSRLAGRSVRPASAVGADAGLASNT